MRRKKYVVAEENSKLAKVLTTLDLTALGIGSTLGVGVYVLAGEVSKKYAGPAVILSFLIAAIASVFSGLCYAEFGARVPKAGSAYVYSYVSVGEFIAFIIGWNLILEYVIGSASVVKGLFTYIDSLSDEVMSKWFREVMPMNVDVIAPYPDFFSLGVTVVFSIALAFGAKESSRVNNVFTVVNLLVVLFVIISGLFHVDASNWNLSKEEVMEGTNNSTEYGEGGFAPYGFNGIIKGAATCFYGFIGFDCIATAGEEAKTPQKSIPIAIVVSLLIIFLAYFGISTVLTMILPYYAQDEKAPLPHMYEAVDWEWAQYLVTAGAVCGLFSSLLGAMFPLPRVIYAMSSDGLLFEFLGRIHPRFKTPFYGTLIAGTFTGVLSCIFELSQLFTMMSLGTLLAYSMVAGCVLILRFDNNNNDLEANFTYVDMLKQMFRPGKKTATNLTAKLVAMEVVLYVCTCFGFAAILSQCNLSEDGALPIVGVAVFGSMALALVISISLQPRSETKLPFMVPLVPWLPALSIAINTYLMTMLEALTWAQCGVWLLIGLTIYFAYGLWHSAENSQSVDDNQRKVSVKQ